MQDLANSFDQLKVEGIKEGSQTLFGVAFAVEKHAWILVATGRGTVVSI
jgi:hypothetical protein